MSSTFLFIAVTLLLPPNLVMPFDSASPIDYILLLLDLLWRKRPLNAYTTLPGYRTYFAQALKVIEQHFSEAASRSNFIEILNQPADRSERYAP